MAQCDWATVITSTLYYEHSQICNLIGRLFFVYVFNKLQFKKRNRKKKNSIAKGKIIDEPALVKKWKQPRKSKQWETSCLKQSPNESKIINDEKGTAENEEKKEKKTNWM